LVKGIKVQGGLDETWGNEGCDGSYMAGGRRYHGGGIKWP